MRKLALGVLVGFLVAASAALAYDVIFPSRLRVQAHALVDEIGTVLLGATPAKIEVTNLPACDSGAAPASFSVSQSPGNTAAANVLTVPPGQRFVLTDLQIGTPAPDAAAYALSDSTGARLFFNAGAGVASPYYSYSTGVPFGPGETVVLTRHDGSTLQILVTLMGRFEPVS